MYSEMDRAMSHLESKYDISMSNIHPSEKYIKFTTENKLTLDKIEMPEGLVVADYETSDSDGDCLEEANNSGIRRKNVVNKAPSV